MTPAGIEPATFRFVAQRLNHCATAGPGDGHTAVRNMYRIEINIHEKELCVKLVIYEDYNEVHGQQNIKCHILQFFLSNTLLDC